MYNALNATTSAPGAVNTAIALMKTCSQSKLVPRLARDPSGKDIGEQIKILELEMRMAADQLDFERVIFLRDQVNIMEKRLRAMEKKVKSLKKFVLCYA